MGTSNIHNGDYALYYNNIKANVATRMAVYKKIKNNEEIS